MKTVKVLADINSLARQLKRQRTNIDPSQWQSDVLLHPQGKLRDLELI
ncbi:hypothetical protein D3800_23045 [Microcystis aeruginosa NIES-298]|uniref:Uncharacterized protein n=1 Tax=Microcystis aeruginosa NIES-298 TaxID=449468 RepID=A0A2H6BWI3_MICAE|nr:MULTISPECIES: hypothetical protein [Microcystis]MDB9402875.1 hypothetical protein [Microcystis sp. CS-574]MDB9541877.1 hypothetical protein [Microcystis aeruginosa CS-1036]QHU85898.1 hypothetical protein D3800_23045 [Microcystis aeruginosa NIES-298]GBD54545.1 hypothetical protein BGM30_36380 [Microcystis aeruginosa NIES-298]GBE99258.1 hypothetical protein NIES298_35060 [Microcystis aeruginosa NIES-298]